MPWKDLTIEAGCQLFRLHNFLYLHKGKTYELEINEYSDGRFVGHGEVANDPQSQLPSVNGNSIDECVGKLVEEATKR